MSEEKPLHVRVAEALGTSPRVEWWMMNRDETAFYITFGRKSEAEEDFADHLRRYPDGLYARDGAHVVERHIYPRYDTDWSATGPLIEKYMIRIGAPTPQDSPTWSRRPKDGDPALTTWDAGTEMLGCDQFYREGASPLIAICNLLLALKETGKL